MRVDLISTGEEILNGEVLDTNAAYAAATLSDHGFEVGRQHTCGDNPADLQETLELALDQADAVICCGGLGPTHDDRTLEAAASVLGVPLEMNQDLLDRLHGRLRRLGAPITQNQQRQARLPKGTMSLPNSAGTATGILARKDHRMLFCLPGPPNEYRPMLSKQVVKLLQKEKTRRGDKQVFARRILRTFGKGEGWIEDSLGDLESQVPGLSLGFQTVTPEVHLKLRARGSDPKETERTLDRAESLIREKLGDLIYGVGDTSLAATLLQMLTERQITLAVAESCTGGLIGKMLTDIPGASKVLLVSAVTYSNQAKTRLLEVPEALLQNHGSVSLECAKSMAEGVRRISGADLGLSVTGIAGPDGGTAEKPIGTVFLAVCDHQDTMIKKRIYPFRDREIIRLLSATACLDLARRRLLEAG